MPQREPLTLEELRTIAKYCRSPVVRALLWEIHRLQGILGRVEQLQSMMRDDGTCTGSTEPLVLKLLREALDAAPCIQQRRQDTKTMLYPDDCRRGTP